MIKEKIVILAIETSCDETAASLVQAEKTKDSFEVKILSNTVASQVSLHKKWGGVYPEVASRAHLEAMIPVLEEALEPVDGPDNLNKKVNGIAITVGPGLIGSLLMGVEATQVLASYFDIPVVPVNHLEGHIYSAFSNLKEANVQQKNIFPILALVVSGGHTSLILIKGHLQYETVGQTLDDAAGEAFDKVARIMDLGYPGGPIIEDLAKSGDENTYKLPLSMVNRKDLNFSFSGLKTAVLYLTKDPKTQEKLKYNRESLAASFQKTVCEILVKKTIQAVRQYQPKTVILGGGVSANGYLRDLFTKEVSKISGTEVLIPPKSLSTDNAAGIAIAGAMRFLLGKKDTWQIIRAKDRLPIDLL
jgi:N6-L-threonylcarbamoyladenine synthase